MKELDDLIAVLEAEIPANPLAPKNIRLANELERELVKYFNKLEKTMPMKALERIYNKYVERE